MSPLDTLISHDDSTNPLCHIPPQNSSEIEFTDVYYIIKYIGLRHYNPSLVKDWDGHPSPKYDPGAGVHVLLSYKSDRRVQ